MSMAPPVDATEALLQRAAASNMSQEDLVAMMRVAAVAREYEAAKQRESEERLERLRAHLPTTGMPQEQMEALLRAAQGDPAVMNSLLALVSTREGAGEQKVTGKRAHTDAGESEQANDRYAKAMAAARDMRARPPPHAHVQHHGARDWGSVSSSSRDWAHTGAQGMGSAAASRPHSYVAALDDHLKGRQSVDVFASSALMEQVSGDPSMLRNPDVASAVVSSRVLSGITQALSAPRYDLPKYGVEG